MKQMTAAFRIYHSHWMFILPEYATISKYQAAVCGIYGPSNKKDMAKHMLKDSRAMLTIEQAAEAIEDGYSIAVADPNDGILIYEIIMEHLKNWHQFLSTDSLVNRIVPIEDLRLLAGLAEKVFPVARSFGYVDRYKEEANAPLMNIGALFGEKTPERTVSKIRYNNGLIGEIERLYRRRQKNSLVNVEV